MAAASIVARPGPSRQREYSFEEVVLVSELRFAGKFKFSSFAKGKDVSFLLHPVIIIRGRRLKRRLFAEIFMRLTRIIRLVGEIHVKIALLGHVPLKVAKTEYPQFRTKRILLRYW